LLLVVKQQQNYDFMYYYNTLMMSVLQSTNVRSLPYTVTILRVVYNKYNGKQLAFM